MEQSTITTSLPPIVKKQGVQRVPVEKMSYAGDTLCQTTNESTVW